MTTENITLVGCWDEPGDPALNRLSAWRYAIRLLDGRKGTAFIHVLDQIGSNRLWRNDAHRTRVLVPLIRKMTQKDGDDEIDRKLCSDLFSGALLSTFGEITSNLSVGSWMLSGHLAEIDPDNLAKSAGKRLDECSEYFQSLNSALGCASILHSISEILSQEELTPGRNRRIETLAKLYSNLLVYRADSEALPISFTTKKIKSKRAAIFEKLCRTFLKTILKAYGVR